MSQERAIRKSEEKTSGENYILSIAIDNYENVVKLNNAVRDVQEVSDLLIRLYQFDRNHIFTLHNEDATEDNIVDAFEEIIHQISDRDSLIIFFSGHGYYKKGLDEGYWIPVDGREDRVSDYISNSDVITFLRRIKAHHVFLVIDSCFSGSLVSQLRGPERSENYPSRRVFASGRKEVVADGVAGENSPFAKGIINFLRGHDESVFTTSKLIDSVRESVERQAKQTPVEGRVPNSNDDGGEFIFRKKLTEQELWDRVRNLGSRDAIQEYLDVFPEGKFAYEAYMLDREIDVREAWESARTSNTPDDYHNFINKYSWSEEYAKKAHEQLVVLDQIEKRRVEANKLKIEKIEEIESLRADFRERIRGADIAFKQKDYKNARRLYYESLEFYREGYDFPHTLDYIESWKQKCNDFVLFFEYQQDGTQSFNNKQYGQAKNYLETAVSIGKKYDSYELDFSSLEKLIVAAEKLEKVATRLDFFSAREELKNKKEEKETQPEKIKVELGKIPSEEDLSSDQQSEISVSSSSTVPEPITVKKSKKNQEGQPKKKEGNSIRVGVGKRTSKPDRTSINVISRPRSSDRKKVRKDPTMTFVWIGVLVVGYFALGFLLGLF